MYTVINFKTKKALKDAVKAGRQISIYQSGPYYGTEPKTDIYTVALEGPHYPQAHTWYATGVVCNGILTSVK